MRTITIPEGVEVAYLDLRIGETRASVSRLGWVYLHVGGGCYMAPDAGSLEAGIEWAVEHAPDAEKLIAEQEAERADAVRYWREAGR